MDLSQYPDLLKDKRGTIDGREFFSRSPFRSRHFLMATGTILACLVMELVIVTHLSGRISSSGAWFLTTLSLLLLVSWFSALRHIRRMRALYKEGLIGDIEAGSPMDIALGIAAVELIDWLVGISCVIFLTLLFIAIHSDCLSRRVAHI
jgi:hypothetical protein